IRTLMSAGHCARASGLRTAKLRNAIQLMPANFMGGSIADSGDSSQALAAVRDFDPTVDRQNPNPSFGPYVSSGQLRTYGRIGLRPGSAKSCCEQLQQFVVVRSNFARRDDAVFLVH